MRHSAAASHDAEFAPQSVGQVGAPMLLHFLLGGLAGVARNFDGLYLLVVLVFDLDLAVLPLLQGWSDEVPSHVPALSCGVQRFAIWTGAYG